MTEHTPGPWSAVPSCPPEGFDGFWIMHQTGRHTDHPHASVYGPQSSAEARANAHLIAAGPELLEACKSALGYLTKIDLSKAEDAEFLFVAVEVCDAAIAKATGGENG